MNVARVAARSRWLMPAEAPPGIAACDQGHLITLFIGGLVTLHLIAGLRLDPASSSGESRRIRLRAGPHGAGFFLGSGLRFFGTIGLLLNRRLAPARRRRRAWQSLPGWNGICVRCYSANARRKCWFPAGWSTGVARLDLSATEALTALKSVRVVDIDLGDGTTERSVTSGTLRAAAALRASASPLDLDPPTPPQQGETVM